MLSVATLAAALLDPHNSSGLMAVSVTSLSHEVPMRLLTGKRGRLNFAMKSNDLTWSVVILQLP